jgi:DNA-binding NarL/FixJ family response regulator
MTTLLSPPRTAADLLDHLSPRELEVLALMAEGRSNRAIGEQLMVALKTVETHVSRVFTKLGLNEDRHENRRVVAVLTFLAWQRTDDRDLPHRSHAAVFRRGLGGMKQLHHAEQANLRLAR